MSYSFDNTVSRFIKSTFLFLILILSLIPHLILRAQNSYQIVDLTFKTAKYSDSDTILIQIQVSRDRDFANIVNQSEWLICQSNRNFTYSADIPMIQGTVLFAAIVFVMVNLIMDILYTFIDPRIRL